MDHRIPPFAKTRGSHPKIFAMIDAYLDESGIHDGAAVCVIAGFYGGRGHWRRFESLWRYTLSQFEVFPKKSSTQKTLSSGKGISRDGRMSAIHSFSGS
jgi:hypothetical protein